MDDTDKTTPGVDGPTAEKTPLTSTFLTREEYEKVGDDPEPLPKGFEVIDGTGVFPRVEEADGPDMGGEAVEKSTGAVATVRSFFSQGAHAVRQVGIAKKAHDAAKEELAGLEVRILERTAELERRRDVTARFDDIIARLLGDAHLAHGMGTLREEGAHGRHRPSALFARSGITVHPSRCTSP